MPESPDISNPDLLPDGREFPFWKDLTSYSHTYHVSCDHPEADDGNEGSESSPWKSIQRAAVSLCPGEEVVVHSGTYREWVRPRTGGESAEKMIRYRTADDGPVVIKGSEIWKPKIEGEFQKEGWGYIWSAPLPLEGFKGTNPFQSSNLTRSDWFPWQTRPMEELNRAFLRQGMLFQDGRKLTQVSDRYSMKEQPGTFWVEDQGAGLWVRLFDDAKPEEVCLEVTARLQCFAPERSLGWISVQGFSMQHAGNGVPMPAFGALSSGGGHHWRVEHNQVTDHNAVGIDFTFQKRLCESKDRPLGGHVVRHNRVASCGITGICGVRGLTESLIEENELSDIGGLNLEHCYEAAGIKFHFAKDALIRRNRIENIRHASGIWMDYLNLNCRIHNNTIHDVSTVLAGIYVEANLGTDNISWVDSNHVSQIRDNPPNDPPKDGIQGGMGISVDVSERIYVLQNQVEDCEYYGIACHRAQPDREIHSEGGGREKRVSNNSGHVVLGNTLQDTKGVLLEAEKGIVTDVPSDEVHWIP